MNNIGHFEFAVGNREDISLQCGGIGIAHDQLSEGVPLKLYPQVQSRGPREVVQPVTVLQIGHLAFKNVVERGAKETTEQVL